jgi:DNA-binding transcriptional MocR family regulator
VVDGLFVDRPTQEAALELVSRAAWDRHLRELAQALNHRSHALASAIATHLPAVTFSRPAGGMHLWARLPAGLDDVDVTRAARQAGVVVMAGRPFFPAEAPGPYLRITFSAAPTEAHLDTGVRHLATAAPVLARPSGHCAGGPHPR